MTIAVFHLDAGGCAACGAELRAAVDAEPGLNWAATPAAADVVALTGAVMPALQRPLQATLAGHFATVPLVVIGKCALDGTPFGRGGVGRNLDPQIGRALTMQGSVDGCPPVPAVVVDTLLRIAEQRDRRE